MRGEGLRWDTDKFPIEYIPLHLLEETARILKEVTTREENPYPMWNWANGMKWSRCYASAMRHMMKWYRGEDNDEETGRNHLAHAMCSLLFLIHYLDAFPEGDDRPKEFFQPGGLDDSSER